MRISIYPGRVIFFPINAPGMGRFQLLNLGVLGYGLELRFWVVIAKIVSLTLTITLITTLTIIKQITHPGLVYLDKVIFHRLLRLSDRNNGCRRRPRYLIFSQFSFIIVAKMRCLRGSARTPPGGLQRPQTHSWETMGHIAAEVPADLRAPGPRNPTIRHCVYLRR